MMAYGFEEAEYDKYGFAFDEDEDLEEDAMPCRCSMRSGIKPSLHNLRLPSVALRATVKKRTHKLVGKGRSQLLRERTLRDPIVGAALVYDSSGSSARVSASPRRGRGRGRGSSRSSAAPDSTVNTNPPSPGSAADSHQSSSHDACDESESTPLTRSYISSSTDYTDYRTKLLEVATRFQNNKPFANLISTFAKPNRGVFPEEFEHNKDSNSPRVDCAEVNMSDEDEDSISQNSPEHEYVIPELYRHEDFSDPCSFYSQIRPARNLGEYLQPLFPGSAKSNKPKFSFPEYEAKKNKVPREELFEDPWAEKPKLKPHLDSHEEFPSLCGPSSSSAEHRASPTPFSMANIAGGLLSEEQTAGRGSDRRQDAQPAVEKRPGNLDHVVCIDNLPASCQKDSLVALLSPYGEVRFCCLEHTDHGSLRAEIELHDIDACEWAVECLNGEDATLADNGQAQRLVCYRKTASG